MFSHYVNHLECTGSLEGHRTLMVHECLVVAAALGWYHRWQCRVSHQDRDTYDWTKVPVIPKGDFRHKYSPALALLGNAQNPAYAHPKLLGRCFGRGLVDLDWSQWTPIFHPDDIDWAPQFNQYPYPDDDLDYDDEEETETDYQNAPPGGAGDARVAPLASAGHRCYRPPATYSMQTTQGQAPGSPGALTQTLIRQWRWVV